MGAVQSLQFAAMPQVEVSHQTLIEEGRKEALPDVNNQGGATKDACTLLFTS